MSQPCTNTASEHASTSTSPDACLTISAPYRTLNRTGGSSRLLADNDRFLLFCQFPTLSLIDRDLTVMNQHVWTHGWLCDMCWSSALTVFVAITHRYVFLLNETTLSCERLDAIQEDGWFSCTCSDTSLFLSSFGLGSSVTEVGLSPSIQLVKRWQSPDTCAQDEAINDIIYKNGTCALIINNQYSKTVRMELRCSTTFHRLWSLQLDIIPFENTITCCSLNNTDEWLVVDCNTCRLLHVTGKGKVKMTRSYNPKPWRACCFGPEFLVMSTMAGVNVHKLQ